MNFSSSQTVVLVVRVTHAGTALRAVRDCLASGWHERTARQKTRHRLREAVPVWQWCLLLTLAASASLPAISRAAADPLRLPRDSDLFFVEDNLAYRRYLSLARDGTYRQINQTHAATSEADNGTWEQTTDHTVTLHSQYAGLRFHALRVGPLTVLLDDTAKRDALPALAATVRRLLDQSPAAVFAADTANALAAPPAAVTVDKGAESFGRADLLALAGQLERAIRTESSRTYLLTPVRVPRGPLLLALQDGMFSPEQLPAVRREYRVPLGSPPPFYFAQTDAATFAHRVGRWQELQPVGGYAAP